MAWYNNSWNYRRTITLSPSTSVADYQAKVTLTSAILTGAQLTSGNANGNDIRFTGSDGTTLQNHWIESWSAAGTTVTAIIWIKIATSGTSSVYLYYGNSSATYDNSIGGTNTFNLFDDFSDSVQTSWTNNGGTWTESGGIRSQTATAGVYGYYSYKQLTGLSEYIVGTKFRSPSAIGSRVGIVLDVDTGIDAIGAVTNNTPATQNCPLNESVGWGTYGLHGFTLQVNTWYMIEGYRGANIQKSRVWQVDSAIPAWQGSGTLTSSANTYVGLYGGYTTATDFDYFYVRKYASPESTTCVGGEEVQTPSWLTGWSKRKSITINGSTAGAQTDYQIKLIAHKETGTDTATDIYLGTGTNIRDDFGDLRFTSQDGSTNLNYWIESITGSAPYVATVWIKIPSIPASPCTTKIYGYYSNSGAATTSNGTNTFGFFDDFADLSKWTSSSGTWVISSPNVARSTAPGGYPLIYHSFSTYNNITVFGKIQMNDTTNSLYYILVKAATTGTDALNGLGFNFGRSLVRIVDNNVVKASVAATFVEATWYNYEFSIASDNSFITRIWKVGDPRPSSPTLTFGAFTPASTGLNIRYDANVVPGHVDYWSNFIIRKYASPEPTTCVGGEEVQTPSWLTGWDKRKSIIVNGSTAGAKTDYQIKLIAHKETGTDTTTDIYLGTNVRDDFGDLRFASQDGSTLLNYWIESITGSAPYVATVWIKIPSIPLGPCTTTIYTYYSKSSAADASNGRNTFIAFDDFATGSSEQWTMAGVTADRTTNHRLNINGVTGSTSAYLDKGADIGDYEFLYTYTRTSGNAAGFGAGTGDTINSNIDSPISNAAVGLDHPTSIGGQNRYLRLYQAGTNYGNYVVAGAGNTLYYGKLTRLNNVYTYVAYSDAARTSQVWSTSATRAGITNQRYIYAVIASLDFSNTATGWLKDIRVRRYASPEPTFSVAGAEESPGCGTPSANLVVLEIISVQLSRKYPSYIDLDAISRLIDNAK